MPCSFGADGNEEGNRTVSVQFGRWQFEGQSPQPDYLAKVSEILSPYGPDGKCSYAEAGATILYFPFHTTEESHKEAQPHRLRSGSVLTWDGRLDSRKELIRLLQQPLSQESSDLEIVAAAYERWGTVSFAKLIGDWALSVWDPTGPTLVLAKDAIGTRHLFYANDKDQVTWCTVLDPLVLLANRRFGVEEEYIAGWLGHFPATHLTPYVGIHSVPPSCFVSLAK